MAGGLRDGLDGNGGFRGRGGRGWRLRVGEESLWRQWILAEIEVGGYIGRVMLFRT